ncbi:MAG: serine hydroxymethyltransferase, partial [Gammaproteobacteria bacterium]
LAHGGHLTHGASVSVSGRIYKSIQYGLNPERGEIDYDQVERLALEHKPKLIMTGFSAYSRIINWQRFRKVADAVGAYLVADIAHVAGLVATGLYPSPIDIADVTTTTTHKTLRGPRSGLIMGKANPEIEKKVNFTVFPGYQGGPLMHVIAAKAVAFKEAMQPEFKAYAVQVVKNAGTMVRVFLDRGIKVVSGGTDNHLFLVDLIKQGLTGRALDMALGRAHITVNKNAVPNDPQPPMVTSGIRIGTPAATTRGFKESECAQVAGWICDIIEKIDDDGLIQAVRLGVSKLCQRFPVYGG